MYERDLQITWKSMKLSVSGKITYPNKTRNFGEDFFCDTSSNCHLIYLCENKEKLFIVGVKNS